MLMSSCYFALDKLKIKRNECFKFYHLLILVSGDVNLNAGPSQYLPDNDYKFEPFCEGGLHFLHINVNSLLSKIDELRDVVGHTKPAILGITESKLDSSVSDQEVDISGYSILRNDRNRYGGDVACYVRADLCFIWEMFSKIQLKMYFSIYLFQSLSLFWLVFSTDHQM